MGRGEIGHERNFRSTGLLLGGLARALKAVREHTAELPTGLPVRDELQLAALAADFRETVPPAANVSECAFSIAATGGAATFAAIQIVNRSEAGLWVLGLGLENTTSTARVAFAAGTPITWSVGPIPFPLPGVFRNPAGIQSGANFGTATAALGTSNPALTRVGGAPVTPLESGPVFLPPGINMTLVDTVANQSLPLSIRLREVPSSVTAVSNP